MKPPKAVQYRILEFARMTGVTVRALRHYERLGLLQPARQQESGYRLYTENDLGRLEQILVLKFLGLPLKQIRSLLRSDSSLPAALKQQQKVLAEKRRHLDKALEAVAAALQAMEANGRPEWKLVQAIIKEIAMQTNYDWTEKYYSKEAQGKIEERKKLWSPDLQEQVSREWAELFREIEAALGDDPASPRAQDLAGRWKKLVEGFTGGDPEIQKGLNAMYADQANWPAERQQAFGIRPEIQGFIRRAMEASGGK